MMIDLIFLVLVLIAMIRGYRRGLLIAIFSFLGIVIGLAAAIKLSATVADYLKDSIRVSARWLPILSFLLVFIGVVILVRWVANLIQAAMDMAMLGWINKIGGAALYIIIFTAAYSVFLFYGTSAHILSPHAVSASVTYPYIKPWGPGVVNSFGKIIPLFKDMFIRLENFFSHFP
jgi:membrane protein required for colicin V production